ncbi:MAG: antibiotic biosynthesis monooxygenase [Hyphomicrobiaceae bacterium]|nr:antibiotic biosynthesis monooxygenase [Hyphomicrobiaceae bacterium]
MFAVIFLVQPKSGRMDGYLELAKFLKPSLEKIDGFIDNERFGSRRAEGRLLSLSTWRDEKALIRWRTLAAHHAVQEKGRFEIFADYHLRVGEIVADTHHCKGQALREQRFDTTEVGEAKAATISELTPMGGTTPKGVNLAAGLGLSREGASGMIDQEVFESIYTPGKLLLLALWKDASMASRWEPKATTAGDLRHRRVRIIRDYGMRDRREAPQYYPAVPEVS